MSFNNQPKANHGDEVSCWYIDPESWEEVRTGHAADGVEPQVYGACIRDGYVLSINYAYEVALRQRGVL